MKKLLLGLLLSVAFASPSRAQLSNGGLPCYLSGSSQYAVTPEWHFKSPDFRAMAAAREQKELVSGRSSSYLVAAGVPMDIGFPASGAFTRLGDKMVWRLKLSFDEAKGVGLYYDRFRLPAGVRYFITNETGTQVAGAYTEKNNVPSGLFASEPLQGNVIELEIDIDAGTDLNEIDFHVNSAGVYFRGADYLEQYSRTAAKPTLDEYDTMFVNTNSVCMVNAVCPVADRYANQRKAVLSIVVPDENNSGSAGLCSASMINTADNNTISCKNYLITGSHCDESNSTAKNRFDQMLLRFNYEQPTCNSTQTPAAHTLVGAFFIARSDLDTVNYIIKGDFLLLRLKEALPASWDITMAGWNRDPAIARNEADPRKFISFHHPYADVKKVSVSHMIGSTAFASGVTEDTHWTTVYDSGYIAPGASGAPLLNGDGYLIGTLTGGSDVIELPACTLDGRGRTTDGQMTKKGFYSKVSYNWDNATAANQKLAPWLDPQNTGVMKIEGVKASCEALDSIAPPVTSVRAVGFDNNIQVYPNPVSDDRLQIRFNLPDYADISLSLTDVNGRVLKHLKAPRIKSGTYTLSVGGLANGMYLLRISDGQSVTGKKIMLQR